MAIEMNANQAASFLNKVAAQAYGSGFLEGTDGGRGSIGMIGGKPVKFNTHWRERAGKATPEMIQSSNELRESLGAAARALCKAGGCDSGKLADIARLLGLDDKGLALPNKGLLSRKVAAQVLHTIDAMRNEQLAEGEELKSSFAGVEARSSKGVTTTFSARLAEHRRHEAAGRSAVDMLDVLKGDERALAMAQPLLRSGEKALLKSMEKALDNSPTLMKWIDKPQVSKKEIQKISDRWRDQMKSDFQKNTLVGSVSQEFLRCLHAVHVENLTFQGQHVPKDSKVQDKEAFSEKGKWGAEVTCLNRNGSEEGQGVVAFEKMVSLIPEDNPHRNDILRLLSMPMGNNGPYAALADIRQDIGGLPSMQTMTDSGEDIIPLSIACSGAPHQDLSIVDGNIVLTQKFVMSPSHFLAKLDGKTIMMDARDTGNQPFSGIAFTTTMTIPLKQTTAPGEIPEFTYSVKTDNVEPHFAAGAESHRAVTVEKLQTSVVTGEREETLELEDERQYIEDSTRDLCVKNTNDISQKSLESDKSYLYSECTQRMQDMQFGDVTFDHADRPSQESFEKALDDVFTTSVDPETKKPVVNENAKRFFRNMVHTGLNYPDNERTMMMDRTHASPTFPYIMNMSVSTRESSVQGVKLRRASSPGWYRAEFHHDVRGLTSFDHLNPDGSSTPYRSKSGKGDPNDRYAYSYALEFKVDKDTGAVSMRVPEPPQVTWRMGDHFEQDI